MEPTRFFKTSIFQSCHDRVVPLVETTMTHVVRSDVDTWNDGIVVCTES